MQEIIEQAEVKSPEFSDNDQKTASIGKFEDSNELLKAYNNLEAEFTRKSQLLKELTKQNEEKKLKDSEDEVNINNKEITTDKESNDDLPIYERQEWKEYLNKFLEENPLAKKYAKELAQTIVEDAALSKDKRCLEVALSRVLSSKLTNPVDILSDDKIREYVLSDTLIKDKIIGEYIESLSSNSAPRTISKGGEITATPPKKIKTIEEAGAMAAEIIKNRRK